MRTLLAVFAVAIVMLGFVTGNLWLEMRASKQQMSEVQVKALRAQFDSGHAARLASFRTERGLARQAPQ